MTAIVRRSLPSRIAGIRVEEADQIPRTNLVAFENSPKFRQVHLGRSERAVAVVVKTNGMHMIAT